MKQVSSVNSVLFIISLASMLVPFMISSLNLALPQINSDLSITATLSGWVQASYMLSTAIFQIPCARLADIIGRRKVFIWGVVLFLIFSILSGFAFSGESLIIYRFFTGIGSAMIFSTCIAILVSAVPKEKRGWALGINRSVVYFALAAGSFLGGVFTESFGWQSIFFFLAFISLIVLVGVICFLKEDWKEESKQKFDWVGSILYAICISALIYGFSKLPEVYAFLLIVMGIVVLLIFKKYELLQSQPVFNMRLFLHNRIFRLSSISALINYSATFSVLFILSLYLQYVRGLSPIDAGLIIIIQAIIQSIVSFKSGALSDKVSPSLLATLGMAIIGVGLVLLCFIDEQTSYYFIGGVLLMLGIGYGMFSSPNTNVIMSSVEPKDYSMASASTGTMRLTGQALSMGIAMMSISLFVGNVEITSAMYQPLMKSLKLTFSICATLCFVGVYTSSMRNKNN